MAGINDMRKFGLSLRRRGGWRKSLASLYCLSAVMLWIVLLCSGCGGGGGGSEPPPAATGTITLNARLTEPSGISDFSGVSISVTGAGSTYLVTTDASGKSTFAGLKITDTTNGTTYNITASKTDYTTATRAVVLLKDGDQQTADLSLQFSASKITVQAWSSFSSGNYNAALTDFQAAASRAVTAQEISESNTGLGWTYYLGFASSDPTKYQSALDSFSTAATADPSNLDMKTGTMFALVDKKSNTNFLADLQTAITDGEQVLTSSPNYSFSKATQFNYVDVHATLAYAYSQKYLSAGNASDKTSTCTHVAAVLTSAPEYATASAAAGFVGGCP